MQHVSGYRFVATIGDPRAQALLTGEVQAPDRVHETITIAGRPAAEVIFIGSRAFVKDPVTGTWRNRLPVPTATSTDVRAAFTALTNARTVTHRRATYTFVVPARAAKPLIGLPARADVPASAHLTNGQIDTLTYSPTLAGRPIQVHVTYTDVGDTPPVQQPAT